LRHERSAGGSARPDCPDAADLAAYYDQGLSADERATLEAHAVSCVRCQDQLAAIARSAPREELIPASPLTSWRWIAVLGTGTAAAVAIWIAVAPLVERELTPQEPTATAVAPQQAVEAPRAAPAVTPAPEPPAPESAADAPRSAGRAAAPRRQPFGSGPASVPASAESPATRADADRLAAKARAAEPLAETAASGAAAAAPPPAAPASPPAAGLRDERAAAQTAKRQPDAPARRESLARSIAPERESIAIVAAAPHSTVRWQFAGVAISRSTDEGRTWTPTFTAPTPIVSAAAVSDLVCWAAGRAGLVMRTVDGTSWERLASPAAADLLDVEASSADEAIVTAANGRRFQTADGGKTWSALQP
jgi:hypothetical protein